MYPFRAWSHPEVVARLWALTAAGFESEAVVAAAQTLEQGLKRVLVYEMNRSKRGFDPTKMREPHLVSLNSKAERDKSIRWLASLGKIRSGWRVLLEHTSHSDLAAMIDRVAGEGTWARRLGGDAHVKGRAGDQSPFGLFPLRHVLVHGWNSPPKAVIAATASDGVTLVEQIFHPDRGLGAIVGYDPFSVMPRWRSAAAPNSYAELSLI